MSPSPNKSPLIQRFFQRAVGLGGIVVLVFNSTGGVVAMLGPIDGGMSTAIATALTVVSTLVSLGAVAWQFVPLKPAPESGSNSMDSGPTNKYHD